MEVAGGGGVQKDAPGDVAVVLLAHLLLLGPANQVGVDKEVGYDGFHHLWVNIVDQAADEAVVGLGGVLNGLADDLSLGLKFPLSEPVGPVYDGPQVLFRVFIEVVHRLFNAELL